MLQTTDTNKPFESLCKDYFAQNLAVIHKWKQVADAAGGRTDLVCWPDTVREVFASLTSHQITVGSKGRSVKDFESFGRAMSDIEVAEEAFEYFLEVIETLPDESV